MPGSDCWTGCEHQYRDDLDAGRRQDSNRPESRQADRSRRPIFMVDGAAPAAVRLLENFCHQPEVASEVQADVDEIDNKLPELVHEVMEPVYNTIFAKLAVEKIAKILVFQ